MPFYTHFGEASSLRGTRSLIREASGVNTKVAVLISNVLGSMAFFWFTICIALFSLPAVLVTVDKGLRLGVGLSNVLPHWLINASLIGLIAWLAQTFIQLVALPVLQVSNNAQGKQQDVNTHTLLEDGKATREHTEVILDRLDVETRGGLRTVLERIDTLGRSLVDLHEKHDDLREEVAKESKGCQTSP